MTAETNSHYSDLTEQPSFEAQLGRHADVAELMDEAYADVPVVQVTQENILPEAGGEPMIVRTPWHDATGEAMYGPLPAGMLVERMVGEGDTQQALRGYIDEKRTFNPIPQDEHGRDMRPDVVTSRLQQIRRRMAARRDQRERDQQEKPPLQQVEAVRGASMPETVVAKTRRGKLSGMAGSLTLGKLFGGDEGRHTGRPTAHLNEQVHAQRADSRNPGDHVLRSHRGGQRGRHAGSRSHVR